MGTVSDIGTSAIVRTFSPARDQISTAPWISIFPGLAIFLTVLGLNLLGDGLRDILDPHSQTRKA